MIGEINRTLAVALPAKALFDAPSVRGLAAAVLDAKLLVLEEDELERLLAETA
jgi:hypothetical protein